MSFIQVVSIAIRKHPTFRRLYYSFFFRLLMLDFKKNLLLLVFWSLLFGMITNNIAPNYGIAFSWSGIF